MKDYDSKRTLITGGAGLLLTSQMSNKVGANGSMLIQFDITHQPRARGGKSAGGPPHPDALGATAIQATLLPQSAQKLTYYSDVWVFA
jgi:hypothetical protein